MLARLVRERPAGDPDARALVFAVEFAEVLRLRSPRKETLIARLNGLALATFQRIQLRIPRDKGSLRESGYPVLASPIRPIIEFRWEAEHATAVHDGHYIVLPDGRVTGFLRGKWFAQGAMLALLDQMNELISEAFMEQEEEDDERLRPALPPEHDIDLDDLDDELDFLP